MCVDTTLGRVLSSVAPGQRMELLFCIFACSSLKIAPLTDIVCRHLMRGGATAAIELNVCVGTCSTWLFTQTHTKNQYFITHKSAPNGTSLYPVFPCLNLQCVTEYIQHAYFIFTLETIHRAM